MPQVQCEHWHIGPFLSFHKFWEEKQKLNQRIFVDGWSKIQWNTNPSPRLKRSVTVDILFFLSCQSKTICIDLSQSYDWVHLSTSLPPWIPGGHHALVKLNDCGLMGTKPVQQGQPEPFVTRTFPSGFLEEDEWMITLIMLGLDCVQVLAWGCLSPKGSDTRAVCSSNWQTFFW